MCLDALCYNRFRVGKVFGKVPVVGVNPPDPGVSISHLPSAGVGGEH